MIGSIVAALVMAQPQVPGELVPVRVAPRSPSTGNDRVPRATDALGSCEGNGRRIDMRRVMILENRSVEVDGPNGPLRLSVEREQLRIARVNDPNWGFLIFEVAYALSPDDDIDIELRLALVEGRPAVYWRETFLHTTFRQGLFSIDGEEVHALCQGEAGVWMSH